MESLENILLITAKSLSAFQAKSKLLLALAVPWGIYACILLWMFKSKNSATSSKIYGFLSDFSYAFALILSCFTVAQIIKRAPLFEISIWGRAVTSLSFTYLVNYIYILSIVGFYIFLTRMYWNILPTWILRCGDRFFIMITFLVVAGLVLSDLPVLQSLKLAFIIVKNYMIEFIVGAIAIDVVQKAWYFFVGCVVPYRSLPQEFRQFTIYSACFLGFVFYFFQQAYAINLFILQQSSSQS